MKRPYVFLCTAMSLDGKLSTFDKKQAKIATDDNKEMLYEMRVKADAIMVGGKTLILDDPKLTVKSEKRLKMGKNKEPFKVAIISNMEEIKNIDDFLNEGEAKKIIFTTERSPKANIKEFENTCEIYIYGKEKVDLKQSLSKLYELGVKTLMVEGGGELIFSLLKENLVDEINLKIGNLILGGRDTTTLCDGIGFTQDTAKKVKLIDLVRKENYLVLKYKFA